MNVIGVIPSRYGSSRFPGKALAMIGEKSMIHRVYEQCLKSKRLTRVIVATDDERIQNEVASFGGDVMMTSSNHPNGTSRCAEVSMKIEADFYINIQGDEPFIHPVQIDQLAESLKAETEIATMVHAFEDEKELHSLNTAKVVMNSKKQALYFSRQVIPFSETQVDPSQYWQHIGIYAYRNDILKKLVKLPESPLEKKESLEQLRWLDHGYHVQCVPSDHHTFGIDTPEDLEKAKALI